MLGAVGLSGVADQLKDLRLGGFLSCLLPAVLASVASVQRLARE